MEETKTEAKIKTIALKPDVYSKFKRNKRRYMDLKDLDTLSDSKYLKELLK